ncbi:MAG: peptidase U32 [Proteobacteria bacterium]|nr:peptidase U32 [Pseudomonadota bacterium]
MNKTVRPERSELLMPAGDLNKLKTAITYGADAIYCGTPDLSLRTKSGFSLEDLIEGIEFAHTHGKKVYLTLNIFSHNKDYEKLPAFVETIQKVNPDGVIIADPGVFAYVKEHAPHLELHISTQANICSWMTVKFWEDMGAGLAVMAREVSFAELSEIRAKCPNIKLEAFVHGAMCMTYSGRCLLSNFMAERGANQGNCAHSCRWNYKLHLKLRDGKTEELEINEENKELFEFLVEEEFRQGELMPIEENERGSYILNSKDLCLMPVLDKYMELGVDSLKIEGRHKNEFYVGAVARVYRKAIDDYYKNNGEDWNAKPYIKELNKIRNRGFTMAFHEGRLTDLAHDYETTASISDWSFGGIITEWVDDYLVMEVRNTLKTGDVLEFLPPVSEFRDTLDPIRIRLYEFDLANKNDEGLKQVNPGQKQSIKIKKEAFHTEDLDTLEKQMPIGTIARIETKTLTENDDVKIKVRQESLKLEAGQVTPEHYAKIKQDSNWEANTNETKPKAPKSKEEGCCGRGCNGCLVFWHDDKYAKARELLKKKKGQKLQKLDKKFMGED